MTQQHTCPKWAGCNAPVCPLDPNYRRCHSYNGEPVCLWLREGMKQGGFERIPVEILPSVRTALPLLLVEGDSALKTVLKRAATSGSKMTRKAPQRYVAGREGSRALLAPRVAAGVPQGRTSEAIAC